MSPNRKAVCDGCDCLHLMAVLNPSERVGERWRCDPCEDAITAEEHAEDCEHCLCERCVRYRLHADWEARQREAATRGGLDPRAVDLLGLTLLLETSNWPEKE